MPRDDYDDEYEDDHYDREGRGDELMPHRGPMVMTLGIISVVSAVLSLGLCIPVLWGLPLGILAWIWGHKDLKLMDQGVMDPTGRGNTMAGFICGIIGTILCGLLLLAVVGYIAFIGIVVAAAPGK